ncbi:hypothetical protein F3K40_08445 [Streptomyces sp. LBUM 1478]|uniref:hypothetical protein n=1 Tax=Streptomyces scabiei TaxID=1930 RepID=UPI00099E8B26|nr:hypothetical protein [Streptomyces scabiei]MBP5905799.1 hypothetical protein [Streptomyces sp. LBUM 1478]
MARAQERVARCLLVAVDAQVEFECCPAWLIRPGRAECAGMWHAASEIYGELTGLVLPEHAPPRERRRLDAVLTYPDGGRQILEVDERQHFTAARAVTLEHYPPDVALGFPVAGWLARSRQRAGHEPGGGFAAPRPPLFPGAGGRHRQRAFRDTLADLLPSEHGWLPTIRISDTEVVTAADADAKGSLKALLAERGVPM